MHPILADLNALHARSLKVVTDGDGDRVPLFITAFMSFIEGQNAAAPLVFNIPSGEDFYATRMNIYLQSRLINKANPDTQSELTFRATDWTSVNEYMFDFGAGPTSTGQYQNKYASCFFAVQPSDGRKFQNAPMSNLHAFSDREPFSFLSKIRLLAAVPPTFDFNLGSYAAYNGGMDFDVEERIAAGSAWNVIITPTFSRDVSSQSVDRREFRVIGILTGNKKVKPGNYL